MRDATVFYQSLLDRLVRLPSTPTRRRRVLPSITKHAEVRHDVGRTVLFNVGKDATQSNLQSASAHPSAETETLRCLRAFHQCSSHPARIPGV